MTVLYDVADHVARITIDRPERLNAVDEATERELQRVWTDIESRDDIWCAVLTGGGEKAFCVGADVKATAEEGVTGIDYWLAPRPGGFGGIATRGGLTVPVIGRVNGHALGGGFEMTLGCDIIVASDNATFGLPEPRIGFIPLDGGMVQLTRQIPYRRAMGILLTGGRFSAAEALEFGLVNEVVAPDALDEAVDRWVDQVLLCAPHSLRAVKAVVRQTAHLSVDDAMARRLPELTHAFVADDREEGVRAFVEKRRPNWQGR